MRLAWEPAGSAEFPHAIRTSAADSVEVTVALASASEESARSLFSMRLLRATGLITKMILSCSTSVSREPLETTLQMIAAAGFEYVDLLAIGAWGHIVPAKLADDFEGEASRIERVISANKLRVAAINFAGPPVHQRSEQEKNTERLRQTEAVARLMQRLGVRICSFYPGPRVSDRDWKDVFADAVQTFREFMAIGKEYGVQFAIEPHQGTPFESVEQNLRLLRAIPDLAVAYDPSHFAMQGIPLSVTEFLLDRACHVHIRDAALSQMCVPLGSGTVDFNWLLRSLRNRGYTGAVTVEVLPGSISDAASELAAYRKRFASIGG